MVDARGGDPGADLGPFGVALFVGYHARAGHPTGTLAHTYSMRPTRTRLGGRDTGEYGFNAAVLGAWGIPVGLVAGDDALAAEVEHWLPWAERVEVKRAIGGNAAASAPSRACPRRGPRGRAARRGAGAGRRLRLLIIDPPVVIEVDYARAVQADHAAIVPLVERVGDRGIRIQADDVITAYRAFLAGFASPPSSTDRLGHTGPAAAVKPRPRDFRRLPHLTDVDRASECVPCALANRSQGRPCTPNRVDVPVAS